VTVKGEAIYRASERIKKYGVEAFIKMLGEAAIKKRGGRSRLLKFYTAKYPEAPLRIEAKAPYISRTMRSYWKDVKLLAKARDITPGKSRGILKRLKTSKNVQVRVIKQGEGWQLIMVGLYEHKEKDNELLKAPYDREEQKGYSYMCYEDNFNDCYDDALDECIRDAQAQLGGSGWILVKIIKETWVRYYGREKNDM